MLLLCHHWLDERASERRLRPGINRSGKYVVYAIFEFKVVRFIPSFPAALAMTPFASWRARRMIFLSEASTVWTLVLGGVGPPPVSSAPTSSRKRVPRCASSTRPIFCAMAPVKAPRSCPKSSLYSRKEENGRHEETRTPDLYRVNASRLRITRT